MLEEKIILCRKGSKRSFSLCKLTEKEIAVCLSLQDTVVEIIGDPTVFQPITKEELAESVRLDSVYGVYDGEKIAAWSMFIHNRDTDRTLADDAGLPRTACLTFDGVLVHPAYRGYGMQRFFLSLAEKTAQMCGAAYVLATVAPPNTHSYQNFQKTGFVVLREYIKYGYPRYLLQKMV